MHAVGKQKESRSCAPSDLTSFRSSFSGFTKTSCPLRKARACWWLEFNTRLHKNSHSRRRVSLARKLRSWRAGHKHKRYVCVFFLKCFHGAARKCPENPSFNAYANKPKIDLFRFLLQFEPHFLLAVGEMRWQTSHVFAFVVFLFSPEQGVVVFNPRVWLRACHMTLNSVRWSRTLVTAIVKQRI